MDLSGHHHYWRIVHSEASRGWGGQEHRVLAELKGFKERGSQVWLLAPQDAELRTRSIAAGIPVAGFSDAKWRFPVEALRLASWLRKVRPHVLNTHSSRDGWLVGLAGRLAGVPLIIRSRHFDVPIPNRWLSRHAYATLCDHVLTTSPKVSAHLRDFFGLPAHRVSTLPTGIDPERFSPAGESADFSSIEGKPRQPRIGLIAVIRQAKGHAILLEAARLLRNEGVLAHYLFVGEGLSRAPLDQKIRDLQLEDCVTFTGFREDIPAVLRALDVLVIPSLHEGVPQVGLQALACRTPVVGSNVGGIPQIIRHGETGRIFPSGDAGKLAACIRDALTQTEATTAMTLRGRELVEANHSLEGMIHTLDSLYRQKLES